MTSRSLTRVASAGAVTALLLTHLLDASATTPAAAPQVLLTITNSESLDGTTAGAIMVGSGSLSGSGYSFLNSSSSPVNYSVPAGFAPPITAAASGIAPYTATCGTNLCDNGASRLNMTKASIKQVLTNYGSTINFGVYDYSTSGTSLYTTWVYQMSPVGGFTYTNTASATTVANPCFNYTAATGNVASNCASIVSSGQVSAATLKGNAYMNVLTSSDNPQVNDVLYSTGGQPVFLDYGAVSPANPYSGPGSYTLNTYNTSPGSFSETYPNVAPSGQSKSTTPTNAGYVPFSSQVMYIQRGFGYGGGQSALTGSPAVQMNTDPTTASGLAKFNAALSPETNNSSTTEIKAVAGQSAIAGLLTGAKNYLHGITTIACQQQYVVLMTDGLPTLDIGNGTSESSAKTWPPLGTATANAYGLTATFDSTGAFVSSNSQAVTDAITAIVNLKNNGVKTYVIGLGAGVDATVNPIAAKLLQAMAIAGGTNSFFPATDPTSLNNAFQVIVAQIYASSSVAAPLVPLSIKNGSSFEYTATTTAPPAGHVSAFPVDATGQPNGAVAWSTDTTMTTAARTADLFAGTSLTKLTALPASTFALTPTTCVPDTGTIVNYTINPGFTGGACTSYLAGRAPNSLLGAFSMQDSAQFFGPPSSALLLSKYPTYLTWARGRATRATRVLFTNSDGFLYAIDATTGALVWGWISQTNVPKLQNYTSFPSLGTTNGDFTTVDAMNGGTWSSYIVGSLNSGGERFSLKLDDTSGMPTSVVYDVNYSGTTAGDTPSATGNAPLRQPPVIAYIGDSAYTIYAITNGTVSTLYETNVATGVTTTAPLTFQVSSALFIDPGSNQLWIGGIDGSIWNTTLTTGTAATDILGIQQAGTTINPATGATVANVQWVSYFKVGGIPYFIATNAAQITVFTTGATGWVPTFSATTTANYTYTPPVPAHGSVAASPGVWTQATNSPNLLTAGAVISDLPTVIGTVLNVPTYVPGSGCSLGSGFYDYFSLVDGSFPTQGLLADGLNITADQRVGDGPAYTPSVVVTGSGYVINKGSANCTTLCGNNPGTIPIGNSSLSWRQH